MDFDPYHHGGRGLKLAATVDIAFFEVAGVSGHNAYKVAGTGRRRVVWHERQIARFRSECGDGVLLYLGDYPADYRLQNTV
jgi:hypothetical protein